MKQKLLMMTLSLLGLSMFSSCSNEDFLEDYVPVNSTTDEVADDLTEHTCEMTFSGDLENYEGTATRAATTTFVNGDVLYIRFKNGSNYISGSATYNSSTQKWQLSYVGSLPTTTNGTCTIYYFEGASSKTTTKATLSESSIPYYTTTGTYAYGSNTLNVSGTLNPMVGRVRFKGTYGTTVSVKGLMSYSSYDNTTGEFVKNTTAKSMYVYSTGYTDYMYCEKAAGSQALVLSISSKQYAMPLTEKMLTAASSGVVTIPTTSSYDGWNTATSSASAVDLGLSVKWASTNLGATYNYNYGDYYAWGETKAYNESDVSNYHNYTYSGTYVKTNYLWNTYKYNSGSSYSYTTKYCTSSSYWTGEGTYDNMTKLELNDDAAYINWGGTWRMPTKAEMDELINKCTWTSVTYNSTYCYKVTGPNGNFIYLPKAGYRYSTTLSGSGSYAYYWTSNIYSTSNAYYVNNGSVNSIGRYYGCTIRPVCPY